MSIDHSLEVRLRSRPHGVPTEDDFAFETIKLSAPGDGEVRVRNDWMSVDPYMRPRMEDRPSYVPPFELGKVLDGGAIGTVVQSNDARFAKGDVVQSNKGWREAFNAPAESLRKVDTTKLGADAYLGVAGMTGLTAYVGLIQIAKIAAGDVVFISAASGAVGSVACQIAKIKGATVIGSAGGKEKCDYLRGIGVDRPIDYKSVPDLGAALADAAPDGIDVYFDNVGGPHLNAALDNMNPFGRIVLCGMISQYNGSDGEPIPLFKAVQKRLRLQGFIVSDHFDSMPRFVEEMTGWIETGAVTWRQTVEHGLRRAPAAFLKLFSGENFGKMLVKLD